MHDYRKTLKGLLQFLVGATILCAILSLKGHAQTPHVCKHDQQTIEYWEHYRIIPGRVVDVTAGDVVIRTTDKRRVLVTTLFLGKDKPEKNKVYLFGFCALCKHLHGFNKLP